MDGYSQGCYHVPLLGYWFLQVEGDLVLGLGWLTGWRRGTEKGALLGVFLPVSEEIVFSF